MGTPIMEYDEMLQWESKHEKPWHIKCLLPCFGIFALLFSHHWIWGILFAVSSTYCFVLIGCMVWWRINHDKFYNSLEHKLDRIPHDKYMIARTLYGDYIKAAMAAIECEEAHIPGDCLLCGAE